MTRDEMHEALREVGDELHVAMLTSARSNQPDHTTKVAAVLLTRTDGTDAVVTHYSEHGDGDGIEQAEGVVKDMKPLLSPGESLRVLTMDIGALLTHVH